jgi:hypothetical protein
VLDHLVAQRLGIDALQQVATAVTGFRLVFHHLVNAFDRQQLRPRARMALLATSLVTIPFAPFGWLESNVDTGGRLGGVARCAAEQLPQAGQFARSNGELCSQLLIYLLDCLGLLLLGQDQRSDAGWSHLPVRM